MDHSREAFVKSYKLGETLGEGGFGMVFNAKSLKDNKNVAVKMFLSDKVSRWDVIDGKRAPREVSLLQKCQQIPGVIKIIDWFKIHERSFAIVMEKPDSYIDLHEHLKNQGVLTEENARCLFKEIVDTVLACTDLKVFHRDIKTENVLVNPQTNSIKLIDFGSGDYLFKDVMYKHYSGTSAYAAPEVFAKGEYYANSVTIWSLGILLYEMLYKYTPFRSVSEIVKGDPIVFRAPISSKCRDLLNACFAYEPSDRLELDRSIFDHPWFNDV